jgi:hypothetical protein
MVMDCVEPVGTRVDNKRRMALSKRSEVSEKQFVAPWRAPRLVHPEQL